MRKKFGFIFLALALLLGARVAVLGDDLPLSPEEVEKALDAHGREVEVKAQLNSCRLRISLNYSEDCVGKLLVSTRVVSIDLRSVDEVTESEFKDEALLELRALRSRSDPRGTPKVSYTSVVRYCDGTYFSERTRSAFSVFLPKESDGRAEKFLERYIEEYCSK